MKTTFSLLALLLVFNFSAFSQNSGTPLRIIFKLKDDGFKMINTPTRFTGIPQIDDINNKYHILSIRQIAMGIKSGKSVFAAEFPSGVDANQVVSDYQGVNDVEYAEQDLGTSDGSQLSITPDDPYYIKQWALNNDGSFNLEPAIAGADIDMERAWGINQGDSNIIVAVLSTGNKMDHPELAGRIWTNTDEIPGNGIDDDGNNYVDDVNGWDFVNNDNNPTDDNSAGTCLAGIIGARGNNHLGDAGINWYANLMIIKALSSTGGGLWLDAANGTYYAVDNGARIVLIGLGGSSLSTTMKNAVDYALSHNVTVISIMGYDNSNVISYPGAFPGVIAVGASNAEDKRAHPFFWSATSGSNYGPAISVIAPGDYIYGLYYTSNSSYTHYWSGTPVAAAHVAGVASLLLAQDPTRTPAQIKSILESTAEDLVGDPSEDTPGWDQYYGHGRINAYYALGGQVGLKEPIRQGENFSVFPNPAVKEFNVTFPDDAQRIQLVNSIGQVIDNQSINHTTIVSFKSEETGIYLVKVILGNGKVLTKKLIINN